MDDRSASQIMRDFALRTGLTPSDRPPIRYLWTDAFAVCNFLALYVERGDEEALRLARRQVDQTHDVLGKHRPDDARRGWISGLREDEGARHPTIGGLRIGKVLPERSPAEAFDERFEWERDGQYFHYLTKWSHALERLTQVTGSPIYRAWAFELAKTAHARFIARSSSNAVEGIYWKMSIDLSRPQVAAMGHHDALDGFLTYQELQASDGEHPELDLSAEIRDVSQLCVDRDWRSDDALGIGGLLCDAWRLALGISAGAVKEPGLLVELLEASVEGLKRLLVRRPFERAAESRLAFREFGLCLGLHAALKLRELIFRSLTPAFDRAGSVDPLQFLTRCEPLAHDIEAFWRDPRNQQSSSWRDHLDINEVMLATALMPSGFLGHEYTDARGPEVVAGSLR